MHINISMIHLSLDGLKLLAKYIGIKDNENKSEDDLMKILHETTKASLSKKKIKGIRKDFDKLRDRFFKPKKKEIRRNLYEIENKKNLSKSNYIEYNYIQTQSKGDKNKNLSPEEYFDIIRPYLSNIINCHKILKNLRAHSSNETQFGEWKIQLTMSINFISSKDSDETRNMHTKSDNIEIIMGSETNDIIEELHESLLQNYHNNLEE